MFVRDCQNEDINKVDSAEVLRALLGRERSGEQRDLILIVGGGRFEGAGVQIESARAVWEWDCRTWDVGVEVKVGRRGRGCC